MRIDCHQKVLHDWSLILGAALVSSALWTGGWFPVAALADPGEGQFATEMIALQESGQSWIEIDLSTQRLIAWEGKTQVYAVIISTGKKTTPTRTGVFKIWRKVPLERMRGADYDVPNVPHAMYYDGGYAIHGAYWHNRFGTPVSHGCVNVAVDHAKWLFEWAPVGTQVVIHD